MRKKRVLFKKDAFIFQAQRVSFLRNEFAQEKRVFVIKTRCAFEKNAFYFLQCAYTYTFTLKIFFGRILTLNDEIGQLWRY